MIWYWFKAVSLWLLWWEQHVGASGRGSETREETAEKIGGETTVACVGGSSRGGTKGRILYVFWNVKRVDLGHERKKVEDLGPYSRNHCNGITWSLLLSNPSSFHLEDMKEIKMIDQDWVYVLQKKNLSERSFGGTSCKIWWRSKCFWCDWCVIDWEGGSQIPGRRKDEFSFGLLILRCLWSLDEQLVKDYEHFSSAI